MREEPNWLHARAFHLLSRTYRLSMKRPLTQRLWAALWARSARDRRTIETRLFGHQARLKTGVTYSIYPRRWPTYNSPLVEIVHLMAEARGGPVDVVDVGAAMGDTALLMLASCPDQIRQLLCVEGNPEYAELLRWNTRDLDQVMVVESLVSDTALSSSLVTNPTGTAVAMGEDVLPARSLDDIVAQHPGFDASVIKIDIDGSDGLALASASRVLAERRTAVLFEWDPGSYVKCRTSWQQPFEVLHELGYRNYVWYDKYGEFSHFLTGYDPALIARYAEICLANWSRPEWHYDVLALPQGVEFDALTLAEQPHARKFKAWP